MTNAMAERAGTAADATGGRGEGRLAGEPRRLVASVEPDVLTQNEVSAGRWLLHCRVTVPRARDEVFAFFERAENLNELTPPWLNFRILTPTPIPMCAGALIDYRIGLKGVPMRWRTHIAAYEPPHRFIDEQVRGPYRVWHHEHTFEEIEIGTVREGGGRGIATVVTDRVHYELKWPVHNNGLGRLVRARMVAPDLQRIFTYRSERMRALFGRTAG